jgi:hypothetical protein
MTHEVLQLIAAVGLGAPSFAAHEHAAVRPVAIVEIALVLCCGAAAVRDVLATRGQSHYRRGPLAGTCTRQLPLWTLGVSGVAVLTLFGMEYAECGSAAFGLGWLGGALVPGAPVLAAAVAGAVGALRVTLLGWNAAFERLIAIFAAGLAHLIAARFSPAPVRQTRRRRRLTAQMTPCARHAGLRAPPLATH